MANNGYVRVKATTIPIEIGNVSKNLKAHKDALLQAKEEGVNVLTFQELSLTGYTLGDMFFDKTILNNTLQALESLKEFSKDLDILFTVGAPLKKDNSLYNTAITFLKGHILGVHVKTYIPNYHEFYEKRYFAPSPTKFTLINLLKEDVPFGNNIVFVNDDVKEMKIGVEICEDLWATTTPSTRMCEAGATIILNLSASNELVGKASYRHDLVKMTSARLMCAYVYASTGLGESTSDVVYGGHRMISENGHVLNEVKPFENGECIADIDLELLSHERVNNTSFMNKNEDTINMPFSLKLNETKEPLRKVDKNPFVPEDEDILGRVDSILRIQEMGLYQRLYNINSKYAVIGLSGGLDSTLALLVTVETFDLLGLDRKNIHCLTLPCFGTSERTKRNAIALANALKVTLKEINISEAVTLHLKDIEHDINKHDTTFENAQARERTQVLFDYANKINGILIGTGDLSEQCLGWTTYNGDHMSSYAVNISIPKTLVIYLCKGYALKHPEVKEVIESVLDTPISPELIPTKNNEIVQKTEDILGPYEFHDFVLFHYLRYRYTPKKIYLLASIAFKDIYSKEDMKKWLGVFFKKFFQNQFKRNCLPDGPKVGSVAISPRGDLRLPSDASVALYLKEIEEL